MAVVTTVPRGREFTAGDLESMPDDGNRYEIVDGALIVTPAPVTRHQSVIGELYLLLRTSWPVAAGAQTLALSAPYPVSITPERLLD